MSQLTIEQTMSSDGLVKKSRELGWDLWRFWGCFTVFMGHNFIEFFNAWVNRSPDFARTTIPKNFLLLPLYPSILGAFTMATVPVFIFISGYFSLGKAVKEDEWLKAKRSFWKYIIYYWKWLAFALILILLAPGLFADFHPFANQTLGQNIMMIFRNFVNTSVADPGIVSPLVSLNYFFVGLAWLALLTPLIHPLFQSGKIKAIRALTLIISAYAFVLPGVRLEAGTFLASNPNSLILSFLSTLNPLQSVDFGWNNYWIACFMLGGLFAVDTKIKDFVKNLRWSAVAVIVVVIFIYLFWVVKNFGYTSFKLDNQVPLIIYTMGGWLPLAILYVIIPYKLNFILKEESFIGRFIIKYSPHTLGVMTTGWVFCSVLPPTNGKVQNLLMTLTDQIWNPNLPFVTTIILFLLNVAGFAFFFAAVSVLSKVPVLGKLFTFQELGKLKKTKLTKIRE